MENLASLILTGSGRQSLKNIIAIRKASHSNFSYSSLSKSIGIKSRSYLSEAINGKKPLNEKHISPLVDLLELEPDEADLLKNKLRIEMGDLSVQEQDRIKGEIRNAEKKFALKRVNLSGINDLNTVLTLSVVLHLFPDNRSTRREILDLFPRDRSVEIDRGISDLIRLGLFVKEGDTYTFSEELQNILHLYTSSARKVEIDYLKSSMREALEHVSDYDKESHSSVFYSGIIATDIEEFKNALGSIKQNIRGIQSQMTSDVGGNALMRFNIQLYPIVQRKTSSTRRNAGLESSTGDRPYETPR